VRDVPKKFRIRLDRAGYGAYYLDMQHATIINLWPTIAECSRDVGQPYETVKQWRRRNSIPAEHWRAVIAAANAKQFQGVTLDALMSGLASAREAA